MGPSTSTHLPPSFYVLPLLLQMTYFPIPLPSLSIYLFTKLSGGTVLLPCGKANQYRYLIIKSIFVVNIYKNTWIIMVGLNHMAMRIAHWRICVVSTTLTHNLSIRSLIVTNALIISQFAPSLWQMPHFPYTYIFLVH